MADHQTPPDKITRYNLPVTEGRTVFFRVSDEGIAPGPDAVSYMRKGTFVVLPYQRIIEVNLAMNHLGKGVSFATMQIRFARDKRVLVTSTDEWMRPTPDQIQEYYRFKADFHARLVAAGASHIRFTTGYTEERARVVKVVLAIGFAVFTIVPLALFMVTGQPQALWAMLLGIFFVLPFAQAGRRNMPASYDPRDPPDMLG